MAALAANTRALVSTRSGPQLAAPRRCKQVARAIPVELLAAAGDVDAPIGVIAGAAVVVTLVATAIIPIALKPGQEAADQIFDSRQKKPLDKKKPAPKKPAPKRR